VARTANFDAVGSHFYGDLSEIEAITKVIHSANQISTHLGDLLSFVAGSAQHRQLLEEFRRQRNVDTNLLYQGLYVQLYASFEWFVRTLIIRYVEELCRLFPSYSELEGRVGDPLKHNYYHTGAAMQQIFGNRTNVRIDFQTLAKNIGSALPDSTAVVLNSTAFALFIGILDSSEIEKVLKRIGIERAFWDRIARESSAQRFFGETRTRRTAHLMKDFLDQFIKRRNNICHKGDSIEPVSSEDIIRHAEFLKIFGGSLIQTLGTHCRGA
jgi:RiboL-PSP-HEPN